LANIKCAFWLADNIANNGVGGEGADLIEDRCDGFCLEFVCPAGKLNIPELQHDGIGAVAEGLFAELIAKEKEIAEAKAIESGKPANIVEKMVTGSVEKYLNEVALDRQMYVIDNEKKVAEVLKATGTTVAQFVRFEVGEGIEKKAEMSFADEVAAAQAAAAQ
jgi:hypothetical protein